MDGMNVPEWLATLWDLKAGIAAGALIGSVAGPLGTVVGGGLGGGSQAIGIKGSQLSEETGRDLRDSLERLGNILEGGSFSGPFPWQQGTDVVEQTDRLS